MATPMGKGGHPTAERAAAIDAAIVEATLTLFSRHGSDFSMDQVAGEADVSKQAIYRRFDSKQALILHAIETATVTMINDASAGLPDDPVAALEAMASKLFACGGADAIGASLHIEMEALRSPALRARLLRSRRAVDDAVRERLVAVAVAGRLVEGSIRVQAEVLLDLMLGANIRLNTEQLVSPRERSAMFAERWSVFRTLVIREAHVSSGA